MNSDLSKRMKQYEEVPKNILMRRMPVIIRIDGRAFHTFTRGFQKPFDEVLIKTMQETTKYLCENIQGCVLGYTQSDEISLVLIDYQNLTSDAWFGYEVQKMCSNAASMATMIFNRYFIKNYLDFIADSSWDFNLESERQKFIDIQSAYSVASQKGAMFDCRVFNLPKEEVTNYFYWRQLDAIRNSIQMVGQANFNHKELQNKSCNDIKDMLMIHRGINWNDLPIYQKHGSCCVKEEYWIDKDSHEEYPSILVYQGFGDNAIRRSRWIIDKNILIFKEEGREYIEKLVIINE